MRSTHTTITGVSGKTKTLVADAGTKLGQIAGKVYGVLVQADGAEWRWVCDQSAAAAVSATRGFAIADGDERYFDANDFQLEDLIFTGTGTLQVCYLHEPQSNP